MKCLLCAPKVAAKPALVAAVMPIPAELTVKVPPKPALVVAPLPAAPLRTTKKNGEVARHVLARRYQPGQIIELRVPNVTDGANEVVYGGLYSDHNALLRDIAFLIKKTDADAIYTGLQEINGSEAYQQIITNTLATGRAGAGASEIVRYRWLLVDIDTVRPREFTKASSTDAEKACGRACADSVRSYFTSLGITSDLIDSGNSYHILAPLDLPATEENELLIETVLKSLAAKFDTSGAKVDTSVYDRPRICKLPGTPSRKGSHTVERPHRYSTVIEEAPGLIPVPADVLLQIAGLKTAPKPTVQTPAASSEMEKSLGWLTGFLDWASFTVQDAKPHEGGFIFPFTGDSECPFGHTSGHHQDECHVGVNKESKLTFKCHHASCQGRGWKEFRAQVEKQMDERYIHGLIHEDPPSVAESSAPMFKHPKVPGTAYDFVIGKLGPGHEGWFPRGDVHLIGGPSGVNKTTMMIELLETQMAGEPFLRHPTHRLPYLILMADRGEFAQVRTADRMHYDPNAIPIAYLGSVTGTAAVREIQAKIEERDVMPAVVFIEGCDMLAENASKMEMVVPFLDALQKLAKHYHIAIIGSVGSPKMRIGEGYASKRDSIFGTVAWSRKTETVAVLQFPQGDDTDNRRTLAVLLRNGPAEKYDMKMENGRLVEVPPTAPGTTTTKLHMVWFRLQGDWFTADDAKEGLKVSYATAYRYVAAAYAKGILKVKSGPKGAAKLYRWNDSSRNPENSLEGEG
jgi:AAA domain